MRFAPCFVRSKSRKSAVLLAAGLLACTVAKTQAAGPASDTLLPATTKGYVSVARATEMKARWKQTQFGRMLDDDIMQPFVEDLRKQLQDKFNLVTDKLGVTWDDLDGVSAGEVSLSLLERKDRPAALALTMDVTDRKAEADKLLAVIEQQFAARRGRKTNVDRGGTTLFVFTVPGTRANARPQETVYFVKNNVLCGVDDRAEAEAMLGRFAGTARDNLRSVAAYTATMERCQREAKGLEPELRWYADPFGFIFAARTLRKTPLNPHDKDMAKIAFGQGFDAIKGAGGHVNLLAEGGVEVLHRTAIHAPPVPGKENDPLRWNLSMRMLQLPNAATPQPPSWAPRMSASFSALNIDAEAAFDNLDPIFDAWKETPGALSTSLKGFRDDLYGPRVDVRSEFIANMGDRLTVIRDYATPITVDSERSIIAIEVKDEAAVALALEKWEKGEGPSVRRQQLGEIVVWERVPPEARVDDLIISSPLFIGGGAAAEKKDDKKRDHVLPNSAKCVAMGHLLLASDFEYLKEVLAGFALRERLGSCEDFQLVVETMGRVAPGEASGWSFVRMDEEVRPTYELIRLGKMPEAETMLGKMLNNLLTTEIERDENKTRKQRIDGSTLPNFEAVRRYFGPAGRALKSEREGWVLSGAILNREAE